MAYHRILDRKPAGEVALRGTLPWDSLLLLHKADPETETLGLLPFTLTSPVEGFHDLQPGNTYRLAVTSTDQLLMVGNRARTPGRHIEPIREDVNKIEGLGKLLLPMDILDDYGQLTEDDTNRYLVTEGRYRAVNSAYMDQVTALVMTEVHLSRYIPVPALKSV